MIFWSLFSLVRNSAVLAVYLLFSVACFFTVHEHLHKVHNLMQSGSLFHKRKLPLNHLFSESILYWGLSFQGSFKNGVVSTSLSRTIIDFMSFSGILQYTSITNKKYRNHVYFFLLKCFDLAGFAVSVYIVKNVTDMQNRTY